MNTRQWLAERWCGVFGGHDYIPSRVDGIYREVCQHCGRQTPGWDLSGPPKYTYPSPAAPPAANVVSIRRRKSRGATARS